MMPKSNDASAGELAPLTTAIREFATFGINLRGSWAELADEYERLHGAMDAAWNAARSQSLRYPARFAPDYVEALHTRLAKLTTTIRAYAEHRPSGIHYGGPPHPTKVLEGMRDELTAAAEVFEERLASVGANAAENSTPPRLPDGNALTRRRLDDLRKQFQAFATDNDPVEVRLIHRTSDAEQLGVTGWPTPSADHAPAVAIGVAGKHSGALRQLELAGEPKAVRKLKLLAERGGSLVKSEGLTLPEPVRKLDFHDGDDGRWWSLLFDCAWSGKSSLLAAEKQLWRTDDKKRVALYPCDAANLRNLATTFLGSQIGIPPNWLEQMPDCYFSYLRDAAQASAELCDVLLKQLPTVAEAPRAATADKDDAGVIEQDSIVPSVPPRAATAHQQYRQAAEALGAAEPSDRDAYDQLAKAYEQAGESADLPAFDTWSRNLREYRRLTNTQKHQARDRRSVAARSVVDRSSL